MTLRGHIRDGRIEVDQSIDWPDGTEVKVQPVKMTSTAIRRRGRATKVSRLLRNLAGKATDMPSDAARNLDHYLYGHKNGGGMSASRPDM